MANPAFGENLSFCGTSSHLFTSSMGALAIVNKYKLYIKWLATRENPKILRKKNEAVVLGCQHDWNPLITPVTLHVFRRFLRP
jgi:hypothetical protein